jgi:hypothetical protein
VLSLPRPNNFGPIDQPNATGYLRGDFDIVKMDGNPAHLIFMLDDLF